MAHHDELLDLADELAHSEPTPQAKLRRSVSTAYYALFHLLIAEISANWNRASSRLSLGRMLEHRPMKNLSERVAGSGSFLSSHASAAVLADLRFVALTFCEMYKKRQAADYDLSGYWERTEVLTLLSHCREAFERWRRIRDEDIAQEYLVKLLIKERPE